MKEEECQTCFLTRKDCKCYEFKRPYYENNFRDIREDFRQQVLLELLPLGHTSDQFKEAIADNITEMLDIKIKKMIQENNDYLDELNPDDTITKGKCMEFTNKRLQDVIRKK